MSTNTRKYTEKIKSRTFENTKIYVCFKDSDFFWLKPLKKNFRHCYLLINDGKHWISIDPLIYKFDFNIYYDIPTELNLPEILVYAGESIVYAVPEEQKQKVNLLAPFSCVEVIKKYLGIYNNKLHTPYQLYNYLICKPENTKL